jgi:NAD(P)-dependent dehydrogenase (short-subunit alcohol dehydrogenase family)
MDLGLRRKVVLIVGSSSGIGAATARLLSAEGARVALVARSNCALAELSAQLGSIESVFPMTADASVSGAMDDAVARTVAHFGALHGLAVIAAPMGARAPLADLSNADWEFYYRNSLMVAVEACRAAIPQLTRHPNSSAVLTSAYSIRAQKPQLVAYTAMKSAVASISKNLAKTYGGQGLRVNCIAPGIIVGKGSGLPEKSDLLQRSDMPPERAASPERARYESVRRQYGMTVALERAGRHEEFADLIAYLLSERASYISGATINIDGGTDF